MFHLIISSVALLKIFLIKAITIIIAENAKNEEKLTDIWLKLKMNIQFCKSLKLET